MREQLGEDVQVATSSFFAGYYEESLGLSDDERARRRLPPGVDSSAGGSSSLLDDVIRVVYHAWSASVCIIAASSFLSDRQHDALPVSLFISV